MKDHVPISRFKHKEHTSKRIKHLMQNIQIPVFESSDEFYQKQLSDFKRRMLKRGIKI